MARGKTNPIPAWSTNLSVNMPQDERDLLGRMAAEAKARSLAQFIKELIAHGVAARCARSARELAEIRRRYYGAALLLLFSGALAVAWVNHEEQSLRACRRCSRRPGLWFEECVTVETETV